MDMLRERCPWDQKQDLSSLRPQTIEELYELTDAIDRNDWQGIKEELGDLLLHIVFYSKIAKEHGHFTYGDVVSSVCDKLVRRHPHIYQHTSVESDDDVKANWQQIKAMESDKAILNGVPQSMPAMERSVTIQKKVRAVGFDWDDRQQVWDKLQEELSELQEAESIGDEEAIIDEMGDVFFSMINYARYIGVDPVVSLQRCNDRFIHRFNMLESIAKERNHDLHNLNIEALESLWQEAKKIIKNI